MPNTRRDVVKGLAFGGLNLLLPGGLYAQDGPKRPSPNGRIRIAGIGIGGRGRGVMRSRAGEEFVAFCDVDDQRASWAYEAYPQVPRFKDYREMFDKAGDTIDAVAVCGPDHVHFDHAMAAVELGKHVYVEKPLCQTIEQTRQLRDAAKDKGVKTQMGNQGHSQDSIRSLKEWFDGDVLGPLVAVDAWTDRPGGRWPQGRTELPPKEPVPEHLDWELWRHGHEVDYSSDFAPFKWRGWTMFGTGGLGDMACHILDPFFFAFEPGMPDWIEGEADGPGEISFPANSTVRFHFPAKAGRPEFILTFWSGKDLRPQPPRVLFDAKAYPPSGSVIYGTRETVLANSHASDIRIIPGLRAKELQGKLPDKTLPRIAGQNHSRNWLDAIRGKLDQACSNFDYAAGLNELVLLGVIAQRVTGKRLEFDATTGRFTNDDTANQLLASVKI